MSMLRQAPALEPPDAMRLARDFFGIDGHPHALPSERDQNFRIDTASGSVVLKLANAADSRDMLEAQNAAMEHAARRGARCPRPLPARDGATICLGPQGFFVRLLSWIPGVPLGRVTHQSGELLEDLGRRVGELGRALHDFDHPAIHRDFHWDLAGAPGRACGLLSRIEDRDWRACVERELGRVDARLAPALPHLRRSTIHNDANDYNIIVDREGSLSTRYRQVVGVIDFGDMVHSVTAADAAVAAAYAALDKPAPLRAAVRVAAGFHAVAPLEPAEIDVLFDLLKLRLCLSACIAASQQAERPGDAYLTLSQAPIRRTLPVLCGIPPAFATAAFREACGKDPVPLAARVTRSLSRGNVLPEPRPIVGDEPLEKVATVLDLGPGSPLVEGDPRENAARPLGKRIETFMQDAGATVGIGRYREPRLLYSSPLLQQHAGPGDGRRTVHLGLDFFAPAGTPVRAPLAGRVHLLADNPAPLDYGPLVVLRHATGDGDEFFTLYGHLTRESLRSLTIGQEVAAGDVIAAIGVEDVNGGWPPHLHFQLIVDLLGLGCLFPGVCQPEEAQWWSAFSPDPGLAAGLPPGCRASFRDEPLESSLAVRRSLVGPSLRLSYRTPLKIVRGWMQHLFDGSGRRYLDAYNNVPHVGHAHPRVVHAAAAQMRVLNTNTRYVHDGLQQFAGRLAATLPDPLRVCYFVSSGSEANELAIRLARAHTGRRDVVVLEHAYHGNTSTLIDISPYKFEGPGGTGRPPWVHVTPLPDVFRGPFRDAEAGARYAALVQRTVEEAQVDGPGPAAFIAETCPSVGGQIVLPPGYLGQAYASVRGAGGVCIADEVQTAYGRMGSSFYAFEDQHVVPDIVVLGKPIGNGYPLGAVVTTEAIAASFDNGMEFFSTFGGSTVSCAVGLAVLDVVQAEDLQAHAARVGGLLIESLRDMSFRHALVGDIRGSGLFLGVDLVADRDTRAPHREAAEYVVNRLREEGVLIGTEGPYGNVLKIRPPMPFCDGDATLLVERLDRVLGEAEAE